MDTASNNGYVASVMNIQSIEIVLADQGHLAALEALALSIAAEDHPEASEVAMDAPEGLRRSLSHFDVLDSDCAWILVALLEDQPVGIVVLSRIPKLDRRLGFLYLDELHVLPQYRRRGIGKALLTESIALTSTLGLAGLRLLARIDNEPARRLYESMGFKSNHTMLYQIRFDRGDTQL